MSNSKVLKVQNLVDSFKGEIFSVEFLKADNTIRKMVCRREVYKHSKGGVAGWSVNPENVGVFEMDKGQYRNFNAGRVVKIKHGGKVYEF